VRSLLQIGEILEQPVESNHHTLLTLAEEIMENWIMHKEESPTQESKEGFRLLALQKQGAKGDPSFNACRETCREVAYHHNLIESKQSDEHTLEMMQFVVQHIHLFISGKIEESALGNFCCSSKPIQQS